MTINLTLIETPEDRNFAVPKLIFELLGIKNAITKKKILGKLSIKDQDCFVNLEHMFQPFDLTGCNRVEIHYEGFQGEFFLQQVRPFWKVSLGDRNKIKIRIGGESSHYYLWIRNKKEKNELKKVLDWCYDNEVQFKEYHRGKRTFKWKNVNFAEIQKIKEKYKLTEW